MAGGCKSWYLDANGRNNTLWPDFTYRFRAQTAHVEREEYVVAARPEPAAAPAPAPARANKPVAAQGSSARST
ncbi:MAG: hypothetical protein ACR2G3_05805 [Solirubrobacterales bacterium]